MNALLYAPICFFIFGDYIAFRKIVFLVFSSFFPFFPVSSSFFRFFPFFSTGKGKIGFFRKKTNPEWPDPMYSFDKFIQNQRFYTCHSSNLSLVYRESANLKIFGSITTHYNTMWMRPKLWILSIYQGRKQSLRNMLFTESRH